MKRSTKNDGDERERGGERERQRDNGCLREEESRGLTLRKCGRGRGQQLQKGEMERGGVLKRSRKVELRELDEPEGR